MIAASFILAPRDVLSTGVFEPKCLRDGNRLSTIWRPNRSEAVRNGARRVTMNSSEYGSFFSCESSREPKRVFHGPSQ